MRGGPITRGHRTRPYDSQQLLQETNAAGRAAHVVQHSYAEHCVARGAAVGQIEAIRHCHISEGYRTCRITAS